MLAKPSHTHRRIRYKICRSEGSFVHLISSVPILCRPLATGSATGDLVHAGATPVGPKPAAEPANGDDISPSFMYMLERACALGCMGLLRLEPLKVEYSCAHEERVLDALAHAVTVHSGGAVAMITHAVLREKCDCAADDLLLLFPSRVYRRIHTSKCYTLDTEGFAALCLMPLATDRDGLGVCDACGALLTLGRFHAACRHTVCVSCFKASFTGVEEIMAGVRCPVESCDTETIALQAYRDLHTRSAHIVSYDDVAAAACEPKYLSESSRMDRCTGALRMALRQTMKNMCVDDIRVFMLPESVTVMSEQELYTDRVTVSKAGELMFQTGCDKTALTKGDGECMVVMVESKRGEQGAVLSVKNADVYYIYSCFELMTALLAMLCVA